MNMTETKASISPIAAASISVIPERTRRSHHTSANCSPPGRSDAATGIAHSGHRPPTDNVRRLYSHPTQGASPDTTIRSDSTTSGSIISATRRPHPGHCPESSTPRRSPPQRSQLSSQSIVKSAPSFDAQSVTAYIKYRNNCTPCTRRPYRPCPACRLLPSSPKTFSRPNHWPGQYFGQPSENAPSFFLTFSKQPCILSSDS